jgi:hypothetical protein
MGALSKRALHDLVIEGLKPHAKLNGPLSDVPLVVVHATLGNLASYCFTMTGPPGGRPVGEHKIQLMVPEQTKGTRGAVDFRAGFYTLLVGWSPEERVFALWDAYLHQSFAYSQNVQVKGAAVWLARTRGLTTCGRRLHGSILETVVLCRHERLQDGIAERIRLSALRVAESQGNR